MINYLLILLEPQTVRWKTRRASNLTATIIERKSSKAFTSHSTPEIMTKSSQGIVITPTEKSLLRTPRHDPMMSHNSFPSN